MTLSPYESRLVFGREDLPRYKVGPTCQEPCCQRPVDHVHHLERRSSVGDAAWVELADGTVLPNLIGLCWSCHDQVTGNVGGHMARIVWREGKFWWQPLDYAKSPALLLDPQPPLAALPDMAPPLASPGQSSEGSAPVDDPVVSGAAQLPGDPEPAGAPSVCPSCQRPIRPKLPELPPGEARPKRTWSVHVPVDDRENGWAIIEELLAQIAEARGRGEHKSWRYYTLVEALVFVVQHLDVVEEAA